uniref:RING-type domain-containing protein n=2 Tax=Rhodosorus marinus TaxID=101924 RepID=A0A7S3A1I5_9RHOD|mmetsp:Transcript_38777/g.153187  ORF Transcript_38777/g.153187 Transcript_38777/m.153187 type:complete len:902 (+) Transcript_38777:487-3192(+)
MAGIDEYPSSDEDVPSCPLCMEELDATDLAVRACRCGYQICLYCLHTIRAEHNSRCPACRTPYEEEKFEISEVDREEAAKLARERAEAKRERERRMKQRELERERVRVAIATEQKARMNLKHARIVQRNMVYVSGLSLNLAREETLRRNEIFGRFGRILFVLVNRTTAYNPDAPGGPSLTAYVQFARDADASQAVRSLNGDMFDGRELQLAIATTKYCDAFVRTGVPMFCGNMSCLHRHEPAPPEDVLTREEVLSNQLGPPPPQNLFQSVGRERAIQGAVQPAVQPSVQGLVQGVGGGYVGPRMGGGPATSSRPAPQYGAKGVASVPSCGLGEQPPSNASGMRDIPAIQSPGPNASKGMAGRGARNGSSLVDGNRGISRMANAPAPNGTNIGQELRGMSFSASAAANGSNGIGTVAGMSGAHGISHGNLHSDRGAASRGGDGGYFSQGTLLSADQQFYASRSFASGETEDRFQSGYGSADRGNHVSDLHHLEARSSRGYERSGTTREAHVEPLSEDMGGVTPQKDGNRGKQSAPATSRFIQVPAADSRGLPPQGESVSSGQRENRVRPPGTMWSSADSANPPPPGFENCRNGGGVESSMTAGAVPGQANDELDDVLQRLGKMLGIEDTLASGEVWSARAQEAPLSPQVSTRDRNRSRFGFAQGMSSSRANAHGHVAPVGSTGESAVSRTTTVSDFRGAAVESNGGQPSSALTESPTRSPAQVEVLDGPPGFGVAIDPISLFQMAEREEREQLSDASKHVPAKPALSAAGFEGRSTAPQKSTALEKPESKRKGNLDSGRKHTDAVQQQTKKVASAGRKNHNQAKGDPQKQKSAEQKHKQVEQRPRQVQADPRSDQRDGNLPRLKTVTELEKEVKEARVREAALQDRLLQLQQRIHSYDSISI